MRIYITSVFVDDQEKALAFYTQKLGFVKKQDISLGEFRWLTVIAPDQPDGPELLLEPNAHAAAQNYCRALFADGIPAASFQVDDIKQEIQRLTEVGVDMIQPLTDMGNSSAAVFADTCGNLIQIIQLH